MLFEHLSEQDKQNIEYWINTYADSDNELSLRNPLEHILRFWDKNKEELYKLLGNNLILSKVFKYTKSLDEAEGEYSSYFRWDNAFLRSFRHFCSAVRRANSRFNKPFGMFLTCPEADQLETLDDVESLFYNLYNGENFILSFEEKSLRINTGCKVSKLLGKIVKTWPSYFSQEDYEEFRIAHSQFTNQNKLTGNLCLSIHPFDYITMSDNDEGWDSCMNWRESGDYRMGTVEMMNSPCVVEAYLSAAEPMTEHYGSFTFSWNSKKWRQLFIVTPQVIMGIKPYPYINDELTGQVLKWLKQLAQNNCGWGPYSDNLTQIRNREKVQVSDDGRTIEFRFSTFHMYNDIYSEHPGYVSKSFMGPTFYLNYSGENECMICGTLMEGEKEVSCQQCNGKYCCSECGDIIYEDEAIFDSNGNPYCSYCAESCLTECEICHEVVDNDFIMTIPIVNNLNNQINHISCCCDCLRSDDTYINDLFGPLGEDSYGIKIIDYNNITEKGFNCLPWLK